MRIRAAKVLSRYTQETQTMTHCAPHSEIGDTTSPTLRFAYVWNESDAQGPWVLMCGDCIAADFNEINDWLPADYDCRCACCGAAS